MSTGTWTNTLLAGLGLAACAVLLTVPLLGIKGCARSDGNAWNVRNLSVAALDSTQQRRLEAIRDSVDQRTAVRDSLWDSSRRVQSQPQMAIRWETGAPDVQAEVVRGDTLFWITLQPYLVNTADTTVRITHFRHLPMPVCRAYYRGRMVQTYDYESVRSIRTKSLLPPDTPFRYKYGGCSIRIEGRGTYTIIAEARLFFELSAAERELVAQAYERRSEYQAIRFEREMQATVPLFLASDPVVVEVRRR